MEVVGILFIGIVLFAGGCYAKLYISCFRPISSTPKYNTIPEEVDKILGAITGCILSVFLLSLLALALVHDIIHNTLGGDTFNIIAAIVGLIVMPLVMLIASIWSMLNVWKKRKFSKALASVFLLSLCSPVLAFAPALISHQPDGKLFIPNFAYTGFVSVVVPVAVLTISSWVMWNIRKKRSGITAIPIH